MDVFGLIVEQLGHYLGWRFYVPLLVVAGIAAGTHCTVGWSDGTVALLIVLVLAGSLGGILWQYLHERNA